MTIPKRIHYCWFGGKPLPSLAEKCIASWQKFLPDYEIKRWDESNFNFRACPYVLEAYEAKKWAFVSDYARFDILYQCGGLYFDTDVEIVKPLDALLARGGFMAMERDFDEKTAVNPGLGLAAPAGMTLYQEILDAYHTRRFVNTDGSLNVTTVVTYTTEILKKHGLEEKAGIQQIEGLFIYPKEYFCPKDYVTGEITLSPNTVAIHHYTASWHSPREAYAYALQHKLAKFLPRRFAAKAAFAFSKVKFEGWGALLRYAANKYK